MPLKYWSTKKRTLIKHLLILVLLSPVINKAASKRSMIMSQFYASILVLIFALAGAAHGFCAHGIGGIGEYSGDCTDSIGKHDNTAE